MQLEQLDELMTTEPMMLADNYYIGMMSGTSLDALDAVLCNFDDDKPRLIATHSKPFPAELRAILLALCTPNGTAPLAVGEFDRFSELDFWGLASRLYGEFASEIVNELLAKTDLTSDDITAIGCHGQTVRHRPEWRFSLQLLDPNILAERTGIAVVSDFRRRDMAVGGQGAPLVPAFHQAIFEQDEITDNSQTMILNLGGIANITVLGDDVIGYDTGVANLLMDGWIYRYQGVGYDKHGDWAKSGAVDSALLDRLMTHPFLMQSAPKSTGRETFNMAWLDEMLADTDVEPVDVQATLCEFTALSAGREIAKFAKTHNTLYVCGGGAYNTHLLTRFGYHLPNFTIHTTDKVGISPTWVEAVAFAWLARQNMLMQTGNLPAVTGAKKGVVLGVVCFG
ncbi:anhydro-N-acetylmuramic acid kinase [Moraxella bovis]|uniref:anhydro-N-acetylmuramic acid kinase n=1 Tax=Moraxella bovis TaxID=476 RepID=UPI002225F078|nr:anhydro-N-acetylmuramic acid kinase [Moraxella bovis]UYZ68938.1 anhydro-N-acetylmuramic acid kinase [Moraxella bovis]UZA27032.1 anhydro-N-acetylmuramic acid kinase [Moraxella bovis]UZA38436.1 anhydro-N-acetylmuramic acid kinase [Moraxella bovis]WAJ73216.1 anhydro-N-acetylmuramic acid kinase [Moraxella bovis]